MENPVWIPLVSFYDAILGSADPKNSGVDIPDIRDRMLYPESFGLSEIASGKLFITDAMTYAAAMAAKPFLYELFPEFRAQYLLLEEAYVKRSVAAVTVLAALKLAAA